MLKIKKIARALVAAALAVVLTTGVAFASYGTATVTADSLRMRSGPTTSSSVVTVLFKGTKVELLSAAENGWYKVNYNGTQGYMSAEWLDVVITAGVTAPGTSSPAADAVPTVNAGPLNVRSGPGTGYSRIGTLKKGDTVTILETLVGWYKISAGDLIGYVSSQYISMDGSTAQDGLVIAGPLNVRSGPGTEYGRIGSLKLGATVTILKTVNGWYQISSGSLVGYVSSEYVSPMDKLEAGSSVGSAAAALAISLIGKPYVYGAEGPNAFDCSGLMQYIYKQLGYNITRTSSSQYKYDGYFVPLENIQPGDLVFLFDPKFDGSGGRLPTTHVGIYVGDGKVVHAATTSYSVRYDNLYGSYYTPYIVGVKRIG